MELITEAQVARLVKFIEQLEGSKPGKEIKLGELVKLMNCIGFKGPFNRSGSRRAFSHEILENSPHLLGGTFSVHVSHNKKPERIIYYDFKKYIKPQIDIVLAVLRETGLIQKGEELA